MRLGRSQLALLLIVEQCTRTVSGVTVGRAFVWEESITYAGLNGELTSFFMMKKDLRSLRRLAELELVEVTRSRYTDIYAVTDAGRRVLAQLRREGHR